jgi:3-mercaptopyruvate sulfurtransferase SseA
MKLGLDRVRPLAGGFEAWRERGYALEAVIMEKQDGR